MQITLSFAGSEDCRNCKTAIIFPIKNSGVHQSYWLVGLVTEATLFEIQFPVDENYEN